ncbi:MAG: isoprenylcysteine carboxylmethyltransferase family protein [Candidatus Pacebacteria bacterium]|nr:isoprenylcysteine carboxylmethyltransferase family protein [Candidatus Paceibacterota bacterium]
MRYISGQKWGLATKAKSIREFLSKEFMILLLIFLIVLQHAGIYYPIGFKVSVPLLCIASIISGTGIIVCFMTRVVRSKTWSRFCEEPTDHKLTTTGVHKISRHPYYLGVILWAVGISILYSNILIVVLAVVWTLLAILVAKKEEKFLETEFGNEWILYKKRTPFLFGVRHLLS